MMEFSELISGIEDFGKSHLSYWGNALAGEVGELCNIIKKLERDGVIKTFNYLTESNVREGTHVSELITKPLYDVIGAELADIFIYLVLTAKQFPDLCLESAIRNKIEKVKQRRKNDV